MFVFCAYHDKVLQRVFDGYMSYSMSDSVLLTYQITVSVSIFSYE